MAFFVYFRASTLFQKHESASNPGGPEVPKKNHVDEGFRMLNDLSQKEGFKCYVFIIPAFDASFSAYKYRRIHYIAGKISERYPNLRYYDLLEDFSTLPWDANKLSSDGLHPNERGHLLLAEFIGGRVLPSLFK